MSRTSGAFLSTTTGDLLVKPSHVVALLQFEIAPLRVAQYVEGEVAD